MFFGPLSDKGCQPQNAWKPGKLADNAGQVWCSQRRIVCAHGKGPPSLGLAFPSPNEAFFNQQLKTEYAVVNACRKT
jgi:hypothetical protein